MTDNRTRSAPHPLILTLEQHPGGDFQGNDSIAIQAGLDYLHRLGGGTLQLGPGVYVLRNTIYLRSRVNLRGAGDATVLRKDAGHCTQLTRDADWYENEVEVQDPTGFSVGGGIMVTQNFDGQLHLVKDTVVGIGGRTLYLSRRLDRDAWPRYGATAAAAFALLTGIGERGQNGGTGDAGVRDTVSDCAVSDLVLDGNSAENPLEVMSAASDGNYAGAVFLQHAHRITFSGVTAQNYNGDGYSFQVCDDISFHRCKALNNANLGFHPGSGSQRPLFRDCVASGNAQGIFFCWGVADGIVERCVCSNNRDYGITIGHRDTDNRISECTISNNGKVGILCGRPECEYEFFGAHRNVIERCTFSGNGAMDSHAALQVLQRTHDVVVRGCAFEGCDAQRTAIQLGSVAKGSCTLDGNQFSDRLHYEVEYLSAL